MMGLMTLAAAAAPVTHDLRALFTPEDYPTPALERGEQGAVLPEILVNPDGRIESCTILATSGSPSLDSKTCEVIRLRAKFSPPRGPDGQPVYQLRRTLITWGLGGPLKAAQNPDMELSLNRAPAGVALPVDVSIVFLRKANGSIASCHAGKISENAPQQLISLACSSEEEPPLRIVVNVKKDAVDALDGALVRFVQDKP